MIDKHEYQRLAEIRELCSPSPLEAWFRGQKREVDTTPNFRLPADVLNPKPGEMNYAAEKQARKP